MKKKFLLRLCLAVLALIMLLSFAGCSASRSVRASSNAKKVVATAGEMEILYDEYYYLAMTRLQQLKLEYGENAMSNPEARAKLESFMTENLLNESHALLAIGASLGIDVEKGDVAQSVDAHMEDILTDTFAGDRDAYIESLRESYLTDRYIRTFVAVENYLSGEVVEALLKNGTLDGSDEAAMAVLNGDDFIRVRQVVIQEMVNSDGKTVLSLEQARAKTETLRAKVLAATTDEARDAAMYEAVGESLTMDTTGDGFYYARGEMTPELEGIAFALPLYGVSEIVEVEGGYAFMMRLPKDPQYIQKYFGELKSKTYYVALNQMIDSWLAENPITLTAFGKSLDPANLDPVEPDGNEGWVIAIPLIAAGLAVIVAIFVIRVFALRSRLKKGKPIGKKKKKKSARK